MIAALDTRHQTGEMLSTDPGSPRPDSGLAERLPRWGTNR